MYARRGVLIATAVLGVGLLVSSNAVQAATTDAPVGRQPDGSIRTAQGQVLTPAGRQVEFGGRPVAVTIRPDGRTATMLVSSAGESLRVIDLASGTLVQSRDGAGSSYNGIAYAPGGSALYSSDDSGRLAFTPVNSDGTLGTPTRVSIPQQSPGANPLPTGIAVPADGSTLYVALSRDNALAVIDVATRTLVRRIPVGNAPHSVLLAAGTVYVSNEDGRPAVAGDFTNDSAGTAIVADRFGGGSTTGTVSVVDTATRQVAATVAVGLHPTAMALDNGFLFVANTNDDTVSVLNVATRSVVNTVAITPFPGLRTAASRPAWP